MDKEAYIEDLMQSCSLRRVCSDDRDLVLDMRNQKHVRVHMLNSDVIKPQDHEAWFKAMLKADDSAYFIFLYDDQPAGVVGFYSIQNGCANWSLYLGEENTPKGLGFAMCSLALQHGFDVLGISKIKTSILEGNIKSCRLHERLGFEVLDRGSNEGVLTFFIKKEQF